MGFTEFKMAEALYNAVKMILPLIVLLIIMGIIVYFVYHMAGSSIQKVEHRKHQKEEEALKSIEVMEETTKNIGKSSELQTFNFQLKEGEKYRIYNLLIDYSFYDPEKDKIVVTVYCNEKPYDVWEFQALGEGDAKTYPAFECPDWDGKKVYTVIITPKKFIKASLDTTGSGTREIIVEHYILEFQVKAQVVKS